MNSTWTTELEPNSVFVAAQGFPPPASPKKASDATKPVNLTRRSIKKRKTSFSKHLMNFRSVWELKIGSQAKSNHRYLTLVIKSN